jgi:hypothetical protein
VAGIAIGELGPALIHGIVVAIFFMISLPPAVAFLPSAPVIAMPRYAKYQVKLTLVN